MNVNLKYGIGHLRFGMTENIVRSILGNPNEILTREDEDHKYYLIYNSINLRLTFYKDEDCKLGYIETSNPSVEYNGHKLLSKEIDQIKHEVFNSEIEEWEQTNYHSFSTLYNEENWITLTFEFQKATAIELGVSFKDSENYLWPDEIDDKLKANINSSTTQCTECESFYFSVKSRMNELCPECAHRLYNYENCHHVFKDKRCRYCYWDKSESGYLKNKKANI